MPLAPASPSRLSTSPSRRIYSLALAVRLANACLSRAFFQPDEYWQALEPAHRWMWGFGWATWEWRVEPHGEQGAAGSGAWWDTVLQGGRGGIRSPLAVLPTAAAYAVLKAAGLDSPAMLALAPRLVQACIAASTDLAVARLARRTLGPSYVNAALFASLSSFFNLHTATRTLSNSTETALTAWAWVYWPWEWVERREGESEGKAVERRGDTAHERPQHSSLPVALAFAALATIMRPSNAVIWLFLGGHLFFSSSGARRLAILRSVIVIGLVATISSFALDSTFYGTPTFTPLRFLDVNVTRSISIFYGVHSAHFYLSQGIPLLLATQLPFFLDGALRLVRSSTPIRSTVALNSLACATAGTIAVYSLLPHKEWRFLHPLLPAMHLLVALSLVQRGPHPPSSASSTAALSRLCRTTLGIRPSHALVVLASVPPAIYLTAFHGLGQALVPAHLHATDPPTRSVGFVMPCHSTAWQAGMHAPWLENGAEGEGEGDRAWFLTCEPPVLGQDPRTYLDQSDFFYASPCAYLDSRFPRAVDPSFPPSPPPPLPVRPRPFLSTSTSTSTSAHANLDLDLDLDLGWRHAWPERIVLFSSLLDVACDAGGGGREEGKGGWAPRTVGALLSERGYVEERRLWNTIGGWHEDERRRGDVRVLVWRGGAEEEEGVRGDEGERRMTGPAPARDEL
ncbi:glycosyltransferase family 22 protein [Rhodotorula graminis WP1]|uniref:Mannosyltransferase n=1 Tax=Rhodotorula graminis (strain WP1) TaxID=578459 RepID=A0A0P9EP18_RHOGW|nr:glycosyltransferase family 22 protein [Rhodotorula graminis WP1]KPV73918.1 glycosyltransferase family 22 protein [Rhodotorula graminis WP1]